MPSRAHKRKKLVPPKGSTREKGDIVEQIVASMHEMPGVEVKRNEYLPAQNTSGRTREFDVLLTSQIAGYEVRVAIECKNEKKLAGVADIDQFIGKLGDVNIPTQQGIFVAVSGYTNDAKSRAEKVGIKTFVLEDIVSLPTSIQEAFQSLIYILLTITNIQVQNDTPGIALTSEILWFRDRDGKVCGAIPDLVWKEWQSGKISDKLGVHQIEIAKPDDWFQIVNGKIVQVIAIRVDCQVTAHVISIPGTVNGHVLVKTSNLEIAKWQIGARFERPNGKYPVTTFMAEDELKRFTDEKKGIRIIINRLRLPRIRWGAVYWPPSESAIQKLWKLAHEALQNGKTFDFNSLNIDEIEGTDMQKLWEPIWKEHPLSKQ